MSLPLKLSRTIQPQYSSKILANSILGSVLDHAWIGNSLISTDCIGGLILPNYAPYSLSSSGIGTALVSNGGSGINTTFIKSINTYPYIQIGYGYFASTSGSWSLSTLTSSYGGAGSTLRVINSSTVGANVRFNYSSALDIGISTSPIINVPICIVLQAISANDLRVYVNGQMATTTTFPGNISATPLDSISNLTANLNGGLIFSAFGAGRVLPDQVALELSRTPQKIWNSFSPVDTPIFVGLSVLLSSITLVAATGTAGSSSSAAIISTGVYTAADISTTGWQGTPDNLVLANNINEVSRSDTSFIQSPSINGSQGPAIFLLNNSLAAGNWEVDVSAKYSNNVSQVKFTLLDSSNSDIGNTGWLTLSSSFLDYTPTIPSSGIATKIKVEVQ